MQNPHSQNKVEGSPGGTEGNEAQEIAKMATLALDTVCLKYKKDEDGWSYAMIFILGMFGIEDKRRFPSRAKAKKAAEKDLEFKKSYCAQHGLIPQFHGGEA